VFLVRKGEATMKTDDGAGARKQIRQELLEELRNDPTNTLWGMPIKEVQRLVWAHREKFAERGEIGSGPRLDKWMAEIATDVSGRVRKMEEWEKSKGLRESEAQLVGSVGQGEPQRHHPNNCWCGGRGGMVGGDGCAVNAHPCPGVPVEAKPEAGAVTDSTIPHLPLECGSRYCAQHRDTWRYYEDHFASVAPSVEELEEAAQRVIDEVFSPKCTDSLDDNEMSIRLEVKALRAALERKQSQ
jgi:hypothetical protein